MRLGKAIVFSASAIALAALFITVRNTPAQTPDRLVRIAELEIDRGQLQQYTAALREEIETSIRTEPGVLSLYAVALKDDPAKIRLLEIYAGAAAYQAHLASPHFKKYKSATQGMVKSLKLFETEPILLGSKNK